MIKCCVATMAYNEEYNIGRMLEATLAQKVEEVEITEIIVVASGCTDRTEDIVNHHADRDARIQLLIQPKRCGKSSAINLLLQNTTAQVIVLVNADTIPAPEAIERLVIPLHDPEIGMTGGHPVPLNDERTFMGYAAHLLWRLHHRICLHHPKMGEMIAFRNFFHQIPPESAVDEASIEPLIRGQGLRLHYAADAIVYNQGPTTIQDFIRQRRRIFAGHNYVRDTLGYRVATMKGLRILWLLLRHPDVERDWRYFIWGPAVVMLEVLARLRGALDYRFWRRKHTVWEIAETTKTIAAATDSSPAS